MLRFNFTPHLEPNIRNIDKLQSKNFVNLVVYMQIFHVKSPCFLWIDDLRSDAFEILT